MARKTSTYYSDKDKGALLATLNLLRSVTLRIYGSNAPDPSRTGFNIHHLDFAQYFTNQLMSDPRWKPIKYKELIVYEMLQLVRPWEICDYQNIDDSDPDAIDVLNATYLRIMGILFPEDLGLPKDKAQ